MPCHAWLFSVGAGDLNSGLPDYTAGTLLTKPLSQLLQKTFRSIGIKYRKNENPQKSEDFRINVVRKNRKCQKNITVRVVC